MIGPAFLLLLHLTAQPEPASRRAAVLAAPGELAILVNAIADPDPVVARTAARLLVAIGPPAAAQLVAIQASADPLLRANAALGLAAWGAAGVEPLAGMMADPDWLVRRSAVLALAQIRPLTERLIELQTEAAKDQSQEVRDAAAHAARQAYATLATIPLPTDGWRFRKDPDDLGREAQWFAEAHDDSKWEPIGIGQFWQEFGHDYLGVAWYRRTFDLPAKEAKASGAYLTFGAVDEDAWVWVNGQFAGEHAIGTTGWDKPFSLDVGPLLRWGAANQITVRVYNSAMAGGIWRPVEVRVLGVQE